MSPSGRPARLGAGGYKRPSLSVLDDLTDPGTRGIPETSGTSDILDISGTSESWSVSATGDTRETADTAGTSVPLSNAGVSGPAGPPVVEDVSGTRGTKKVAELRDHVKVARSLADEMRDAVWFFSEHGRPRVQLGELLDEAVAAWLDNAKSVHNGGQSFPRRGRLR